MGIILATITSVGCPVIPTTYIYFHISSVSGIGSGAGSCVVTTYSDAGNTTVTTALNTSVTVTVEFQGSLGGIIPATGIINPGGSSVTINQGSFFSGGETLSSVSITGLSPTSGTGQTYVIN